MAGERQLYLPRLSLKDLPLGSGGKEKTCSLGTTFLTPRAIDALVTLILPVTRLFIDEVELGYGEGDAVRRIIEKIIDGFPQDGKPGVSLVGIDKQIEVIRGAARRAESLSRIGLLGGDGRSLPFPDKARDFVLAAGLLTQNIKDGDVSTIIKEAVRVAELIAICDFEILDPEKDHQRKIIDLERLRTYQRRYKVTAEALDVPYGTIISTIFPDSEPELEGEIREVETRGDIEGLARIYHQNQDKLRLSRHFERADLENWLSSFRAKIAYSEVGVPYLSPSQNPLSGIILIGYSPRESW